MASFIVLRILVSSRGIKERMCPSKVFIKALDYEAIKHM